MKPLKALTPADFPGYDADRIHDWLRETRRANANLLAAYVVVTVLAVMALVMEPVLLILALLFAIVLPFLVYRTASRLRREANLTPEAVAMARQGALPPAPAMQPEKGAASAVAPPEEVHV